MLNYIVKSVGDPQSPKVHEPKSHALCKILFRFWHTLPPPYGPLGPYGGSSRGEGYIAPSAIWGCKRGSQIVGKFVFPIYGPMAIGNPPGLPRLDGRAC